MIGRSNRSPQGLAVTLVVLVVAAFVVQPAWAQVPSQTVSSSERDGEFAQLVEGAVFIEQFADQLKRVARFVRPNVVHIEAHKIEGRRTVDEAGSGVIVRFDSGFYVLTNRHVIKHAPADQIEIKLYDGRVVAPRRVWADGGTDVAVMQLPVSGVTAARIGDSDQVEIGDFVMAVGSPFGLSHSITYGIISAKERRDLKLGVEGVQYQNFFQTDAAINPGNSGGPLVNLRGEVVGLNTAIASNSGGNDGIGFSIPIDIAVNIAQQLAERGTVTRAFFGVVLDAEFDTEAALRLGLPRLVGARVKSVSADSSAEKANIHVNDIILDFDGVRIEDDKHLVNQVKMTPIGKQVNVVVLRSGKTVKLNAQVGTGEAN